MSAHLKSQEFDDLLLGIAASETTAHLNACPQCRAEAEAMRQRIGSFRAAAVSWSEGASRQVTLPEKQSAFRPWLRPAWMLATAAVLIAVTIPLSVKHGQSNKPSAVIDAQAQISRDNELLAQIESEVGETTPSPMQPLQVNSYVRPQ
jgi:anti-sigma factor RsiW